jgi:hypothetical protein
VMYIRAAPRTESGPFVAAYMIPLGIAAVFLAAVLHRCGVMTAALSFSLVGIMLDILGALTLGSGLMLSRSALVRDEGGRLTPQLLGRTAWERFLARGPIALARKFGPSDPQERAPTVVQEIIDTTWGLALLYLGFIGQALGAGLSTLR